MDNKHGNLSINSENIFPIIKKWLYSDHDIFYRELISNGCDAITKLKKLDMMGEYAFPADYKPQIQVTVNPDEKTLSVTDNGIGMTAEEVEEYINQIAFYGAADFLEKYNTYFSLSSLNHAAIDAGMCVTDPLRKQADSIRTNYMGKLRNNRRQIYAELVSHGLTTAKWKSEQQAYAIIKNLYPDAIYQYKADKVPNTTDRYPCLVVMKD